MLDELRLLKEAEQVDAVEKAVLRKELAMLGEQKRLLDKKQVEIAAAEADDAEDSATIQALQMKVQALEEKNKHGVEEAVALTKESMMNTRIKLLADKDKLLAEKDELLAEKVTLLAEKDRLLAEHLVEKSQTIQELHTLRTTQSVKDEELDEMARAAGATEARLKAEACQLQGMLAAAWEQARMVEDRALSLACAVENQLLRLHQDQVLRLSGDPEWALPRAQAEDSQVRDSLPVAQKQTCAVRDCALFLSDVVHEELGRRDRVLQELGIAWCMLLASTLMSERCTDFVLG